MFFASENNLQVDFCPFQEGFLSLSIADVVFVSTGTYHPKIG